MKKIFTTFLLLFGILLFSQQSEDKYHRAKIYYDSPEDWEQLRNSDLGIDHGIHKKNVYFESDFSLGELQRIEAMGFHVSVTIPDVGAYYRNQNDPVHKDYVGVQSFRNASCTNSNDIDYQTPVNFDVQPANAFGGFYTYSEVLQELDDMANLYPNLITTRADISTFLTEGTPDNSTTPSIGGNTIQWVKISDNPNSSAEGEPQLLYTSLHHAREPASMSQLIFYMWYLLENYATDPEVQAIINSTELFFVPVVNPDGYLYIEKTNPGGGGFWRKNRKNSDGVDNNRNYDYYINGDSNNGTFGGPGSSPIPTSSTYHGTGPFSEIENQAIKWFVEQHDFVIAVNNHTFGQLLYYPFGYADVATPDEALFQGITAELVSKNGYDAIRDFPFSGDSDDFMYGTVGTHQKIFAMTPEVGSSFWPAQSSIESICKDMMYLNLTAANMVNNYATIENNVSVFVPTTTLTAGYKIKRLGLIEPANFTVSVNPVSSNIISTASANTHNNLTFLQQITDSIEINLDPAISEGDLIEYELLLNNGLFDRVLAVTRIFGQPTVELDEMGNDTTTNWALTSWSPTTEDFVSSASSITDSPNAVYANNANSTITLSSPIDLSAATTAVLSFQAKWEIEGNFDYVQVEISTNNGIDWIPQCGRYTNIGVADQAGANNEPVYDGEQADWVLESIDLSDYLGNNVLIRFHLVSDGSVREDGFYFDDLQVGTLNNNLSVSEFDVNSVRIFPNPVNDQLHINTSLFDYEYSVYSIQGQKIMNSRNQEGNTILDYSKLSPGLYILTIQTGETIQSYKVIKQ